MPATLAKDTIEQVTMKLEKAFSNLPAHKVSQLADKITAMPSWLVPYRPDLASPQLQLEAILGLSEHGAKRLWQSTSQKLNCMFWDGAVLRAYFSD